MSYGFSLTSITQLKTTENTIGENSGISMLLFLLFNNNSMINPNLFIFFLFFSFLNIHIFSNINE